MPAVTGETSAARSPACRANACPRISEWTPEILNVVRIAYLIATRQRS